MTILSTIVAMLKTGELEEIIENGRIKLRATHQDIWFFRKVHAASIRTEYLGYQEHRNPNQLMHFFAHQMTIIRTQIMGSYYSFFENFLLLKQDY